MTTNVLQVQAGHALATDTPPPLAVFDPRKMEPGRFSPLARLVDWVLRDPRRVRVAAWILAPIVRFPPFRLRFVTGYDDVREVLEHSGQFTVPWARRMQEMTSGVNFVLGMRPDAGYRDQYRKIAAAFPIAEIHRHVALPSWEAAQREVALAVPGKPFDAVETLVMAVPARITESYYGVRMPRAANGDADYVLFTRWTLAASSYTFGGTEDKERSALGLAGAAHLTSAIHDSIAAARLVGSDAPVMNALVGMGLDDHAIHAILFGMVLGFIPTDVLAGGNMLETLLNREDAMRACTAAALANDDGQLWKCLRETLRFRHINPGPLRLCAQSYTLGAGSERPVHFRPGEKVWAMTQLGMFDPRRVERPRVFDPDRPDEHSMIFGVGQHWCVGAYIAEAQLTQTFKALLQRPGLRVPGGKRARVKRFQTFYPLHLEVEYA